MSVVVLVLLELLKTTCPVTEEPTPSKSDVPKYPLRAGSETEPRSVVLAAPGVKCPAVPTVHRSALLAYRPNGWFDVVPMIARSGAPASGPKRVVMLFVVSFAAK